MRNLDKSERDDRLINIKKLMPTFKKDEELQKITLKGQNVLKKEKKFLEQLLGKDLNSMRKS